MRLMHNKKGETLIETLAAILIFALASIVLYSMVTTATQLNHEAREMDEAAQEQLLIAESANPDVPAADGTVTITVNGSADAQQFAVSVFGGTEDENGNPTLYSYFMKPQGVQP